MNKNERARGFTVVEMLTSMLIMGLVLALAIVEFAMVFNHNNLMNANLSADQNARIAMARVTNELRQAMPDVTDFGSTSAVVLNPPTPAPSTAPTTAQSVEFYRVHNGPGGLVSPIPTNAAGDPIPCYDDVTLAYNTAAHTITRTIVSPVVADPNCPTVTTTTDVIAYNIAGFTVSAESSTLLDVDLQTVASNGNYGIYDLNSQVRLGYK